MQEDRQRRKEEFRLRTKKYALDIVRLYAALPKRRSEVDIIARQMVRSGTSVAANYREASRARSTAEFISKVETCTQEADETLLWLELLEEGCGVRADMLQGLKEESDELIRIFVTMAKNAKGGV
jgi:four helix bundle protein